MSMFWSFTLSNVREPPNLSLHMTLPVLTSEPIGFHFAFHRFSECCDFDSKTAIAAVPVVAGMC